MTSARRFRTSHPTRLGHLVGLSLWSLALAAFAVGAMFIANKPAAAQDLDAHTQAAQAASQPTKLVELMRAAEPMLVRVAFTLKYDRGEEPSVHGLRYRCPNCGGFHYTHAGGDVVKEKRPMEIGGFAIDSQRVVISDPLVDRRFIDKIEVSDGDATVAATIAGWAKHQRGVVLKLEEPLPGVNVKPFDGKAAGPFFAVTHSVKEGRWTTAISPMGGAILWTEGREPVRGGPNNALILAANGAPVSIWMNETMPLDDSWKGSPTKLWDVTPAKQMAAAMQAAASQADHLLPRVHLSFRSPAQTPEQRMMSFGRDQDDQATERDVPGIVIGQDKVLVLASLKPQVTARLERVRVHIGGEGGQVVDATFLATLEDYGALVVKTDKPLKHAIELSAQTPPHAMRDQLWIAADLKIAGEQRVVTVQPTRVTSIEVGHKRMLFPETPGEGESHRFLLTPDGQLLALPLTIRQPKTERWMSDERYMVAVSYLAEMLAEPQRFADANNVPLSEAEENRLAWLGVELQSMTPDLARENQVADQTQDGQTGAIVSYIYPGSPADQAGLQLGDVLLRLQAQGFAQPIPIQLRPTFATAGRQFPWERLDQLPEAYFDRLPQPWPSARNELNVQLTELGFGTPVTLQYAREGKVAQAAFKVTKGPDHYDSATKYQSKPLGVTARELTYELRRYFQLTEEAPGLILSKVEAGSKASVAGLRPYEILTHVGDKPLHKADDLKEALATGGEIRFSVKRMQRQRIVKLELPAAK